MNFSELLKANVTLRVSTYLTVIALVLGIIGLFLISSVTTQIQNKRALLDARGNIQLNFEQVLDLYSREYEELNNGLQVLYPETTEIIEILEELERRSKTIGIDVSINNVPFDPSAGNLNYVRYQVSFTSNSRKLLQFLDLVNDLPIYTEIQTVHSALAKNDIIFEDLANHQVVFDLFTK